MNRTKRLLDVVASAVALIVTAPVIVPMLIAVWAQDRHSPFYVGHRIGKDGAPFRMIKVRSMVLNADTTGVDSTAGDDKRITAVGIFVRRFKLDEVPQLWNVIKGEMSLVGPRPNVERDVALYTEEEKRLLIVRPGITDLASIVFADEGEILEGSEDPDLDYNQRIRPYKNRLALLLIDNENLALDLRVIGLTMVAGFSRQVALKGVTRILQRWNADPILISVSERTAPLAPYPPPGATAVVESRSCSATPA